MNKLDNLMELVAKVMPYLEKQTQENPELLKIVKELEEHLDTYYGEYD